MMRQKPMWTWAPWGGAHQVMMYCMHLWKVYIVDPASIQRIGGTAEVSLSLVSPAALCRVGDEQWELFPVVSTGNTLHSSALAFPPDWLAGVLLACRYQHNLVAAICIHADPEKQAHFFMVEYCNEFRSLTASGGNKMLCSLVVQQLKLLHPDGSRVNRLFQDGCCLLLSFGLCADVSLHRCHWCSVDGTSDVPVVGFHHLL